MPFVFISDVRTCWTDLAGFTVGLEPGEGSEKHGRMCRKVVKRKGKEDGVTREKNGMILLYEL